MASTQSGIEPPSGIQGKGTVSEPFDQGNAPENIGESGQEPLSGVQGKGTVTEPYDQGNAGESTTSSLPTNTSTAGSSNKTTSDKADGGRTNHLSSPTKAAYEDRDVSPGTMPDGSHHQTSGDRGEGYEPSKGLNRLKGKLGFGKH